MVNRFKGFTIPTHGPGKRDKPTTGKMAMKRMLEMISDAHNYMIRGDHRIVFKPYYPSAKQKNTYVLTELTRPSVKLIGLIYAVIKKSRIMREAGIIQLNTLGKAAYPILGSCALFDAFSSTYLNLSAMPDMEIPMYTQGDMVTSKCSFATIGLNSSMKLKHVQTFPDASGMSASAASISPDMGAIGGYGVEPASGGADGLEPKVMVQVISWLHTVLASLWPNNKYSTTNQENMISAFMVEHMGVYEVLRSATRTGNRVADLATFLDLYSTHGLLLSQGFVPKPWDKRPFEAQKLVRNYQLGYLASSDRYNLTHRFLDPEINGSRAMMAYTRIMPSRYTSNLEENGVSVKREIYTAKLSYVSRDTENVMLCSSFRDLGPNSVFYSVVTAKWSENSAFSMDAFLTSLWPESNRSRATMIMMQYANIRAKMQSIMYGDDAVQDVDRAYNYAEAIGYINDSSS